MTQDVDYLDPDLDDDGTGDGDDGQQQPNFRRRLEQQRDRHKKTAQTEKARADGLERQLAFARAGIDPEDPKMKYFAKGYDGEFTKEAIIAEATAAGLIEAKGATDNIPEPERDAHTRMEQTNAGAQGAGGRDWDAEMRNAPDRDALHAIIREKNGAGGVVDD